MCGRCGGESKKKQATHPLSATLSRAVPPKHWTHGVDMCACFLGWGGEACARKKEREVGVGGEAGEKKESETDFGHAAPFDLSFFPFPPPLL